MKGEAELGPEGSACEGEVPSPSSARWVVPFDEADPERKDLLGAKGANLAAVTALGLPVPPGFIVTTEACRQFYRLGQRVPPGLWEEVFAAVQDLEARMGRGLGDPTRPLLVSVRSGAAVSMPGMMDTILNLGINDRVAEGIAEATGRRSFALDLYRRFVQMYGSVVMGVDGAQFEGAARRACREAGVPRVADMAPEALERLLEDFRRLIRRATGRELPQDPYEQLRKAVQAVFNSWNNRRAVEYRNYHGIPHDLGTAVNIMAMVYGNWDDNSCTGVLFTRDPATGRPEMYGEYLVKAQGEDVVAGVATPKDLSQMAQELPQVYHQLKDVCGVLERHYRDAQDVEFTVERGKLYILQTRTAKRSAQAALRMATDMVQEGLITPREAVLRVTPEQMAQLLLPALDPADKERAVAQGRLIATGLGASPGGATGRAVFDADRARELSNQGESVILVRPETSAEDVHGMMAVAGVLTARGGTTSHAAVVARGLGKPCVTGAEGLEVDPDARLMRANGVTVHEGQEISIDGSTGQVFLGRVATVTPSVSSDQRVAILLKRADGFRRLGVRANADYPRDARLAADFGAEGIGLCRTEHMFFEQERLDTVREMIMAAESSRRDPDDAEARRRYTDALRSLQEYQVSDFTGILEAMDGKPVVVRLLDPPLHEFLPRYEELAVEVARMQERADFSPELEEKERLLEAVEALHEANPMLGLRGCRLGIVFPEIYTMQVQALMTAAARLKKKGKDPRPEIMVPLVAHAGEMKALRQALEETARRVLEAEGVELPVRIGTMVETPRAAVTADQVARWADFFSFGTNDLTQMAFGISRDDAQEAFLTDYLRRGILAKDPFRTLDAEGVGQLVTTAFRLGRQARPDLEAGICGEHGGDPDSIRFFHKAGLDYVSCSPYRVPVARLAAAQAALEDGAGD